MAAVLYIGIIVVLTVIDQVSKIWMYNVANGQIGFSIPLVGNFLRLTYVENHGGIFGIFQGKIIIFTIVSAILIIYLSIKELKNFKHYPILTKIGICIISAGAIGNMIDRIFRGFVIDMIDFRGIWSFVFNIADMYIHIGLYCILIDMLIKYVKNKKIK